MRPIGKLRTRTTAMAPALLMAFVLSSTICSSSVATAGGIEDRPNRFALLRDLRDGMYDALDSELSRWQEAFERDARAAPGVDAAFQSFASSDPTLERPLQEWVERQPPSFAARAARGIYFRHQAELSRGSKALAVTPPQRLAEMDRYDLLAAADLEAAIKLRPQALAAHASLVAIAVDHRDAALLERRAGDAVAAMGPNVAVCAAYIGKFDPRSGGSRADLATFVATPQYHTLCDSLAAEGRYFIEMAAGEDARDTGDIIAAVDHFSLAASLSGDHSPRLARGVTFFHNGWYAGAIAEFDRLIAGDPDDVDALFWRGMSKWRLRPAGDDLADIDAAIALDPYRPDFLALRGELLFEQGRPGEATADFENAMRFGEYDESIQDSRAIVMMRKHDLRPAAQAYERLVQLAPQNSRYWRDYAVVLVQLRDCRALEVAASFRSLCPHEDSCTAGLQDSFFTEALEELRVEKRCPGPE